MGTKQEPIKPQLDTAFKKRQVVHRLICFLLVKMLLPHIFIAAFISPHIPFHKSFTPQLNNTFPLLVHPIIAKGTNLQIL